jgi:hypothetical protein
MEILAAGNEGSGALQYLRSDLFHRAAIHTYMPTSWASPDVRRNLLTIPLLVMLTSRVRYLTPKEQAVMHAALRRTAKVVRRSASRVER